MILFLILIFELVDFLFWYIISSTFISHKSWMNGIAKNFFINLLILQIVYLCVLYNFLDNYILWRVNFVIIDFVSRLQNK